MVEALVAKAEPSVSAPPPVSVQQFQRFPIEALPEPTRNFVVAGSKAIGCDPCYVALPQLIVLASAIGNTRRLRLKSSWSAPPILWGAIVGDSGTAKSPAFALVMRPVQQYQQKAIKRYANAVKSYEVELVRYEKALSQWKRDGDSSDAPPENPVAPQPERFIVSDTTVEAIVPVLLANPRGVLMSRDELSGFFGSLDRYAGGKGGADAAFWMETYFGACVVVDRKTGPMRTISVPSASVCLCGGIQPGVLRRALGVEHRESGLAARLLLCCPPRKAKRWTDAEVAPETEAEFAQLLGRLYGLLPIVNDDGEMQPVAVGMTPEAKTLWEAYYNANGREQVDLTGDLAAVWSKMEECAARLALVIHLTRCAAGDPTLQSVDLVDAASMTSGIKLAEWFKQEARRVYALLDETDTVRDQRRLVEWIASKGGVVSPREVQSGCRWLHEPGMAEAALNELASDALGDWTNKPTTVKGGRPSRVFHLRAESAVDETSIGPDENRGSVDADSADGPELRTPDGEWGEL